MGYSFYFACAGIELRQYQMRLDEERWVLSFDMNQDDPINIDLHCNDQWMSMQQVHPKFFKDNKEFMDRVNKGL